MADPAVDTVGAFTGGGGSTTNTARMFIALKPLSDRKVGADQVIARLRGKLASEVGASTFLRGVQDINIGGRTGNATFQFTLQGDNLDDLTKWSPKMLDRLKTLPQLADVNIDQQDRGLDALITIDRDTASRLGVTAQMIDETLYDAFGQRPVSTMYRQLNQYHVVMEVAPQYWQSPDTLKDIYVRSSTGAEVRSAPLLALSDRPRRSPLITRDSFRR
jgi:multidrug efflux pump